jgi:glucose-1-phosphate cytidylyltransferase
MKAAILVGGLGTRIRSFRKCPKPLIKVNKIEILKHIIDIYCNNNIHDFILLCREDNIQDFINFKRKYKKFNIEVVNSKNNSNTSKRISFLRNKIKKNDNFCLTYGDSVANFDFNKSIKRHLTSNNIVTLSLFKKKLPYGFIEINNKKIKNFYEKKNIVFINAGFYILNERILNLCKNNNSFEYDVLPLLVKNKKVGYNFIDKWHPMDTKEDHLSICKFLKDGLFSKNS